MMRSRSSYLPPCQTTTTFSSPFITSVASRSKTHLWRPLWDTRYVSSHWYSRDKRRLHSHYYSFQALPPPHMHIVSSWILNIKHKILQKFSSGHLKPWVKNKNWLKNINIIIWTLSFFPFSLVDPDVAEWATTDRTLLSACVFGKTTAILLCSLPRCKTVFFKKYQSIN